MNGPTILAQRLAVLLAVLATAFAARAANACETISICAEWTMVELDDAPFGDLVTDDTYPARGARATIIRPYPEPALSLHLDSDGCGTFDSQFTAGHKMLLYSEAVVGFDGTGRILVRTYESEEAKNDQTPSFFEVDVPSIPDGSEVMVSAPADAEHRIALLANAVEVLHRLHGLDGNLLTNGYDLDIFVNANRQNGSAPPGEISVGSVGYDEDAASNTSAIGKKFILAHEIGHWIQIEVTGSTWDFNYNYGPVVPDPDDPDAAQPLDPAAPGDPFDEDCHWAVENLQEFGLANPNRHGIRSAEFVSGAMPEGFGHFVAAVAYNSDLGEDADGEFRYYKDAAESLDAYDQFEDPDQDNRVVSLLGGTSSMTSGGADRWVELQCGQDFDHPLQAATLDEEVSSEVDWLRFFWRFVTAPYSPQSAAPTFWDVVHLVTFTQDAPGYGWNDEDHVLWPTMHDAIGDAASGLDDYEQRFEDLSADYGVHNDGP